jgi:hypothetical protein
MAVFLILLLFNTLGFAFSLGMEALHVLPHLLAHPTSVFSTPQASTMYQSTSAIAEQMVSSTLALSCCALVGSLQLSIGPRPPLHSIASTLSMS